MSGHPRGYWCSVRTYFAQNRIYAVNMTHGITYQVRYRNTGYVQIMIKSMLARNYDIVQLVLTNRRTEGNDIIDTYTCYNGDIEVDFLIFI